MTIKPLFRAQICVRKMGLKNGQGRYLGAPLIRNIAARKKAPDARRVNIALTVGPEAYSGIFTWEARAERSWWMLFMSA
jgi:hypothetical protein